MNTGSTQQDLLTVIDGPVARITFNRPMARNAITSPMVTAFAAFLQEVAVNDKVRCVVLTGTGDHFMAGGDVGGFGEALKLTAQERGAEFKRRASDSIPLFKRLLTLPQPVVARIRGACAGAGVGFASCCDFVVADETAMFLVAHVNIGTSPDGATSYALPRKVGASRALEMAMLGNRINVRQAHEWGLVNRLVVPEQLDTELDALVNRIIALPASAVRNIKVLFGRSAHNALDAQLHLEAEKFGACAAEDDFVEGVSAFLEKRRAEFNQIG